MAKWLSFLATAAWALLVLDALGPPAASWATLVACMAGTCTVGTIVLWCVPPVTTAWRGGYRAAVRDLSEDRPDLDGLTIPDEWP